MADDHQETAGQEQVRAATHLFLVRLWVEQSGDHSGDWSGRVQHVLRGEARSFVGWDLLKQHIQAMMAPPSGPDDSAASADEVQPPGPP